MTLSSFTHKKLYSITHQITKINY